MHICKYIIREWIELAGISILITLIWEGLELFFVGEIKTSIIDTIITTLITLLLHYKYKKYIRNYDIKF